MLERSERQILKGIKEGNPEAFTAIVDRYYKSVYSLLAYLSRDKHFAEDLTQDTFTSAWTNIRDYKGRASLKTWLHRIAYNKFLDSERKLKQTSGLISGIKGNGIKVQNGSDPLNEITQDEHSRILFDAMQKLGPDEYAVIVLHYIQGFSYREIAEVLNEPAGTVKWRTSRAIEKLRETLTDRIEK